MNTVFLNEKSKQQKEPDYYQWWIIDKHKSGNFMLVYVAPSRNEGKYDTEKAIHYMEGNGMNCWDFYETVKNDHAFIREVDVTITVDE